ncbi:MAG: hypothetical protein JOY70_07910 [Acidisphaera sp.]|nr:hypothetical protein [Acidisphaera sp.]
MSGGGGDGDEPTSRRGALVALAVVVVLVIGGIVISQVLHNAGRVQDCVMQGRRNCAPVSSGG